jgi:hypothetical protein
MAPSAPTPWAWRVVDPMRGFAEGARKAVFRGAWWAFAGGRCPRAASGPIGLERRRARVDEVRELGEVG